MELLVRRTWMRNKFHFLQIICLIGWKFFFHIHASNFEKKGLWGPHFYNRDNDTTFNPPNFPAHSIPIMAGDFLLSNFFSNEKSTKYRNKNMNGEPGDETKNRFAKRDDDAINLSST